MSEFKFSCPFCEQHLQCDEKLCGRQIQCPACQHLLRIPPSPAKGAEGNYDAESGRTWATFIAPAHAQKPKDLKIGDTPKPPPLPE